MKQITLDYFGFTGTGPTVKDAKLDAGRRIEALHSGGWHPAIFTWKGCAVLVYRTIHGWNSSIIQSPERPLQMPDGWSGSGEDRKETIRQAQRHLVDIAWHVGDPIDDFPEWLPEDLRKDLRSTRQWHIRYREAIDAGKNDEEARYFANYQRYMEPEKGSNANVLL